MRLFYTIGIGFYTLGIRLAALFGHTKARQMVGGWKVVSGQWSVASGKPVAWFHAASLGEFEQARPVLERYKAQHPDSRIIVTFFSPSGYEVRKNYSQADVVRYLPMDTPRNVRRFLDTYRPTVAFFVKYEFWYNYLDELRRRGVPTYIFSAIFRPDQYFFKWYGGWFRRQLKECFAHLFVQNEESLHLLKSHGIDRYSLAGDTRFDRVHQIAQAAERDATVDAWLDGYEGKVLVGGSTWPPDEELLTQTIKQSSNQAIRIILAPHVISEEHLKQIEQIFPESIRYSKVTELLSNKVTESHSETQSLSHPDTHQVLIIDNIGLLSKLYRYADVAYIGGGFGVGIHNILEAVTFGKPVLFGPNYHKFQEAHDIIARGGGFSHSDGTQLVENLQPLLTDTDAYRRASQACLDYMDANLGSTDKILNTIEH